MAFRPVLALISHKGWWTIKFNKAYTIKNKAQEAEIKHEKLNNNRNTNTSGKMHELTKAIGNSTEFNGRFDTIRKH